MLRLMLPSRFAIALALIACPTPAFAAAQGPSGFPKLTDPIEQLGRARPSLATVTTICPDLARGGKALIGREQRFEATVSSGKPTASDWADLACNRAGLWLEGATAKEGPALGLGQSWRQGAVNAAIEALQVDAGNPRAAELLGLAVLAEDDRKLLSVSDDQLVSAIRRGVGSRYALRACSELSDRLKRSDDTKECVAKALAIGRDSTWHLLRRAELDYRLADSSSGEAAFYLAAAAAVDSEGKAQLAWHARWFLAPDELAEWEQLPGDSSAAWLRDRLTARDIRDARPLGSRLAEHFVRLAYVKQHFAMVVPQTRSRALSSGPAATEDGRTPPQPDTLMLISANPEELPTTTWREYLRWQVDFDDRGVVWMRFGPPLARTDWACKEVGPPPPCLVTREEWRYEVDGKVMVVNFENEGFDGSVEPTRLVTGALGNYTCDLDPYRCFLTGKAGAGAFQRSVNPTMPLSSLPLKIEEIGRLREEDRALIDLATTKDDNSVRGGAHIDVSASLFRLWEPTTGRPTSLIPYAITAKDLDVVDLGNEGAAMFTLELRSWDPLSSATSDTVVQQRLILPANGAKRDHLTGYLAVPLGSGTKAWSLAVTQTGDRRGRAFEDQKAPISGGDLALSDLIVGAESQGATAEVGTTHVVLAPLGVIDRTAGAHLYYQLRSRVDRADVISTFRFFRTDGSPKEATKPVLQLAFGGSVRAGINEVARLLDLSKLSAGSYRLEVTVHDSKAKLIVTQSTPLLLK